MIDMHVYISQHLGGYSQQDFYTLCRGETLKRWILTIMFIVKERDSFIFHSEKNPNIQDSTYGLCTIHCFTQEPQNTLRNSSTFSRRGEQCQLKTKGHPYFMLAPLRWEKGWNALFCNSTKKCCLSLQCTHIHIWVRFCRMGKMSVLCLIFFF